MKLHLLPVSGPLLALVAAAPAPSGLPAFKVFNGHCDPKSHIAKGPIGSDLTKRQTPYSCDSAIISTNSSNGSTLFQFVDRRSGSPIGFAGQAETPYLFKIERVYLQPAQPVVPNWGYCRLWNGEKETGTLSQFTAILCGAQIDEGGDRTVPVITFKAN